MTRSSAWSTLAWFARAAWMGGAVGGIAMGCSLLVDQGALTETDSVAPSGGGALPICSSEAECPPLDEDCDSATCESNECTTSECARGKCQASHADATKALSQTPGDCLVRVCDGEGNVETLPDPDDPESDSNDCTVDVCEGTMTVHTILPSEPNATMCNGGGVCNALGQCVGCIVDEHCTTDDACKAPTCGDDHVCGFAPLDDGTLIGPQDPGDCVVHFCNLGKTTPLVNNTEVPPDDGNPCTEGVCTFGIAVHNPVEEGTSCAGGTKVCSPDGVCVACNEDADCDAILCQIASCVEHVCSYVNVPEGTPAPDDLQVAEDCKVVTCDGNGAISPVEVALLSDALPDGDPCTNDACNGTIPDYSPAAIGTPCFVGGSGCDGLGNCVECTSHESCSATTYCDTSIFACVVDKANGASCSDAAECGSGYCADGVCCNTACAGKCKACVAEKKGSGTDGACGDVQAWTDPDGDCANHLFCLGGGGLCGATPAL